MLEEVMADTANFTTYARMLVLNNAALPCLEEK